MAIADKKKTTKFKYYVDVVVVVSSGVTLATTKPDILRHTVYYKYIIHGTYRYGVWTNNNAISDDLIYDYGTRRCIYKYSFRPAICTQMYI